MPNEQIREALKHCLQVLDLAAGEGLHYKAGGETFDAGDAVFDLAKAVGANIANEADIPGVIASLVVDRLTTPADLCGGEVVCKMCQRVESDCNCTEDGPIDDSPATPQQPAADPELIARIEFVMNAPAKDRWKVANLTNYDWRRILAALSSRSATPEVGGDWPHDWLQLKDGETFPVTQPVRDLMAAVHMQTGGGHKGATEYRGGAYDSEPEIELLAKFAAAIRAETTAQVVAWLRGQAGQYKPDGDMRFKIDMLAAAIQSGDHLTGGGE